jgi:hypothetical protein
MLEISAPGPTPWNNYSTFNNPNGSVRDDNGVDAGSVYYAPLSSVAGTMTLSANSAHLVPTMIHVVRVIPMSGGSAVGEASDVASIGEDGLSPADGGYVNFGFGIDTGGTDAFITSNQVNALGQTVSSVELFDQQRGVITKIPELLTGTSFETWGWGGAYGGDNALIAAQSGGSSMAYQRFHPLSKGAWIYWTPTIPATMTFQASSIPNPYSTMGIFLTYDSTGTAPDNERLYTQDLANGKVSPFYDISKPLVARGYHVPLVGGDAFDDKTNEAFVAFGEAGSACGASTIVNVNLTTAAVGAFAGASGLPLSFTIDPESGDILETTQCQGGFGIYDVATHAGRQFQLPGGSDGVYTAVDSSRGFFIAQVTGADLGTNNNALSTIQEYDSKGRLLKTLERFELFDTELATNIYNLQLNPPAKTGYIVGPQQQQLEPFDY